MPRYDFRCSACGRVRELTLSMAERQTTRPVHLCASDVVEDADGGRAFADLFPGGGAPMTQVIGAGVAVEFDGKHSYRR